MSQTIEKGAPAGRAQTIEPIRQSIDVARSAEAAFRFFVEEFSAWWPRARHSVSAMREGREAVSITLDGRVGGRVVETDDTGAEIGWGRVLTFEPGKRLVMSWHPGSDPAEATEVEFRFVASGAKSCRLELEHRNWHKLSQKAQEARDSYESGWQFVIGELDSALKA